MVEPLVVELFLKISKQTHSHYNTLTKTISLQQSYLNNLTFTQALTTTKQTLTTILILTTTVTFIDTQRHSQPQKHTHAMTLTAT